MDETKKSLENGRETVISDQPTPVSELSANPMETVLDSNGRPSTSSQEIPGPTKRRGRERPAEFKSTTSEIICVMIMALGIGLPNINLGAMQISLPKVSNGFEVVGGSLIWAVASFSLANGAFLLIMGGIADAFSRKWALVVSFGLFAVFCLICGFVHNFVAFCIIRALQGLVGSAAVPAALGILGRLYRPGLRKNRVMATLGGGAPIGFAFGIITGGICCQFLSWRAMMFFQAILFAIATVGAVVFIPEDYIASRAEVWQKMKAMDYSGMFLALAGLIMFTFSLTQAQVAPLGWKTPYVIALLVTGFVCCVLFCLYEAYIASKPLLPMTIWKYPGVGLCMAIASLGWMSFTGITIYYMTLYFQVIEKTSSILTTAYFLTLAVAGTSVNVIAAFVLHRVSGTILMIMGMTGYTVSALIYSFLPIDALYWRWPFPAMICAVVGADLCYNVGTLHTLNSVSKEFQSTAGSLFNTNLQLSITVALSISSAIVAAIVPDQSTATGGELLKGFHGAFYMAVGFSGFGLFLSFFLRIGRQGHKLDEEDNARTKENENIEFTDPANAV